MATTVFCLSFVLVSGAFVAFDASQDAAPPQQAGQKNAQMASSANLSFGLQY
jgi:hypothetical protein